MRSIATLASLPELRWLAGRMSAVSRAGRRARRTRACSLMWTGALLTLAGMLALVVAVPYRRFVRRHRHQ